VIKDPVVKDLYEIYFGHMLFITLTQNVDEV
jgi:hypothetical protein